MLSIMLQIEWTRIYIVKYMLTCWYDRIHRIHNGKKLLFNLHVTIISIILIFKGNVIPRNTNVFASCVHTKIRDNPFQGHFSRTEYFPWVWWPSPCHDLTWTLKYYSIYIYIYKIYVYLFIFTIPLQVSGTGSQVSKSAYSLIHIRVQVYKQEGALMECALWSFQGISKRESWV